MTRRAKWLTLLFVLALAAALGAGVFSSMQRKAQAETERKRERPPLEFLERDTVRLQPRKLQAELVLPGTLQAVSQATVRAKLAAEVKRVLVREGDHVAAGQLLAEFDTAQLRALLAERAATLGSVRAQLANTERLRRHSEQLLKQNFVSQSAYDSADSGHQAQLGVVAAAQAQLDLTELQLKDAAVRAPIAGSIAKRYVQPGEKVGFDAPLLLLVNLAQLEVQVQSPIADVTRLRRGMAAQVEIEGIPERTYAGRIERINPSAEPGTRTIHLYVSIANEDAQLRGGMFARVHLDAAAEREVQALPQTALRGDGGKPYVWVLAGGKIMRRDVVLGQLDARAQLVEVSAGISRTDVVIATQFDNLKDGLAATVTPGPPRADLANGKAAAAPVKAN